MVRQASQSAVPVYSTEQGRLCPDCGQPVARCSCRAAARIAATGHPQGIVRVGGQTKGRKGSGVTVITGLCLSPEGLRSLSGRLKKLCGAGGTLKDGVIEIQGEHRDLVIEVLRQLGYKVQRAGG